jgi:hypothetical protein
MRAVYIGRERSKKELLRFVLEKQAIAAAEDGQKLTLKTQGAPPKDRRSGHTLAGG